MKSSLFRLAWNVGQCWKWWALPSFSRTSASQMIIFDPPSDYFAPSKWSFFPSNCSLWDEFCRWSRESYCKGRFYQLVFNVRQCFSLAWMSSRLSHRGFFLSFSHVARYAPSWKTKNYGTIVANTSQANLWNLPKLIFITYLFAYLFSYLSFIVEHDPLPLMF